MKATRVWARCLAFFAALSLLSGCTQLPDLKPFADATTGMAGAMRQGYAQTEEILIRTGVGDDKIKELRDRWEPTRKAVAAMVAYSDALAALGDAGNKGEESAGALISSLEGVQQAVGALIPGLPVAAVPASVTAAFRKISGVVAKIRARRALKEIITDADDALSAAADILALNFRDLARIHSAAGEEVINKLDFDNNALRDYNNGLTAEMKQITVILTDILDYQNEAKVGMRAATLTKLRGEDKDLAAEIDAGTKGPNAIATTPDQIASLTLTLVKRRQAFWDARVKYLQGELDRIAPQYNAYLKQRQELKNLKTSNGIAFSATVIETWATTHSGLKSALNKKQRVTVSELTSVVNELVELAKKKEEKKNGSN